MVIITSGYSRKALAIVRDLGSKNIKTFVGDTSRFAMSFFSKYCYKKFIYKNPVNNEKQFIKKILEVSKKDKETIFPINDEENLIISEKRSLFEDLNICLPNHETLLLSYNKFKITKFVSNLGIPTPTTYYPRNMNELKSLLNHIVFPVVIKPIIGFGAHGVRYASNKQKLLDNFIEIKKRFGEVIVQEFIEGPVENSFGYSSLFLNGKEKAFFVHRKLRTFPVEGGPSTFRMSVRNKEIEKYGREILKKLNWNGIAMLEFKIDTKDKKPKFLEINPRFWGSLSLAIYAGVDFPYFLYKITQGEKVKKIKRYKIGVKSLYLLGDIGNFFKTSRFQILKDVINREDILFDVESFEDPLPAVAQLFYFLIHYKKVRR